MPLGSRLIPLVNRLPQRKTIFPKFVQCFLHFIVVAPLGCASYRKLDAVCEMVLFLAVRGLNQAKQQSAPECVSGARGIFDAVLTVAVRGEPSHLGSAEFWPMKGERSGFMECNDDPAARRIRSKVVFRQRTPFPRNQCPPVARQRILLVPQMRQKLVNLPLLIVGLRVSFIRILHISMQNS